MYGLYDNDLDLRIYAKVLGVSAIQRRWEHQGAESKTMAMNIPSLTKLTILSSNLSKFGVPQGLLLHRTQFGGSPSRRCEFAQNITVSDM